MVGYFDNSIKYVKIIFELTSRIIGVLQAECILSSHLVDVIC